LALPDPNSPHYAATLLEPALISLLRSKYCSQLLPEDSENVALEATVSLVKYVASNASAVEVALEELRDIAVE